MMPEEEYTLYNDTSGTWLYNREARKARTQAHRLRI